MEDGVDIRRCERSAEGPTAKMLANEAAVDQLIQFLRVVVRARAEEDDPRPLELIALGLVDCPGGNKVLARTAEEDVMIYGIELVDLYGELAPQVVEQSPDDFDSQHGLCFRESLVLSRPFRLVRTEFVEIGVIDAKKAGLLEVGSGHAPPGPQIDVEAIREDLPKRPIDLFFRSITGFGVLRVLIHRQIESVLHRWGEFGVVEAAITRCGNGPMKGSAQNAHLNEVIEVTGLKGPRLGGCQ